MRKEVFIDVKTGEIVKSIATYEIFENYNIFQDGYEENYQKILESRNIRKMKNLISELENRIINESNSMMKSYKSLVIYLENKKDPFFSITDHKKIRNDIHIAEYSINLYKSKITELLSIIWYEEEC